MFPDETLSTCPALSATRCRWVWGSKSTTCPAAPLNSCRDVRECSSTSVPRGTRCSPPPRADAAGCGEGDRDDENAAPCCPWWAKPKTACTAAGSNPENKYWGPGVPFWDRVKSRSIASNSRISCVWSTGPCCGGGCAAGSRRGMTRARVRGEKSRIAPRQVGQVFPPRSKNAPAHMRCIQPPDTQLSQILMTSPDAASRPQIVHVKSPSSFVTCG
mmetsp:Transcript_89096/g.238619  ORF Transcript_89096/g.238619 Transcript_89096/m.238619 type:complete len:216 (+) Transcript_89096:335-982(+)